VYTAFGIRFISASIPQFYGMLASTFFSGPHSALARGLKTVTFRLIGTTWVSLHVGMCVVHLSAAFALNS
jgi:hypothetical protein